MNLDLKLQTAEDFGSQGQIIAMFPKGLSQQVRDDIGEGCQSQITLSHGEELGFYSRANEKLAEDSEKGILLGCHGRMDLRGKNERTLGSCFRGPSRRKFFT